MEPSVIAFSPNLLDLPVQVRLNIYEEYFENQCHPPAEIVHEEPLSTVRLYWQPALLTVNKQINSEILDLFRMHKTFTYRISWQESIFDQFSMCCFCAQDLNSQRGMKHLRVEIYPPHRDRPMDYVHILRSAEGVRNTIASFWKPQHLSIVFMENDIASWSHNSKPRESMQLWGYSYSGADYSDIVFVMDTFDSLANITKATIQLPASFSCDEYLQKYRWNVEKMMMGPPDEDVISVYALMEELVNKINEAEPLLKEATGKVSRATIEAISENGLRRISPEELHRLKQIWPYTDTLADRDYFPDHKYTWLAPRLPSMDPNVPRCSCKWTEPADQHERRKALIRAAKTPDWYLSGRMTHEVMRLLEGMRHCQI